MTTDSPTGTDLATVHPDGPRTTDLAIRPDQSSFDDVQLAALRALGVEDAPKGDIDLLFHQSVRLGLDPFAKQIYLIGRASRVKIGNQWQDGPKKWTIQTGIDGFRVVRDRPHPGGRAYDGQEIAWCGTDGVWRDVWTDSKPPFAARVLIYVRGRSRPEPGIAYYSEYAQTDKDGNPQAMWKKMPAGQLAKCAEALALRKAFPQDLSGVYVDEEMQQADVGADGVPSVTSLPNRNPGHNEARGVANGTGVNARSSADGTPASDTRPRSSRTKAEPGAGRTDEPARATQNPSKTPEDQHAIADEWALRARNALTVTDARDLYRDAKHRGILDYPTTTGELLEDVLRARGEHLADEENQAAAGEPDLTLPIPSDEYPDPVY